MREPQQQQVDQIAGFGRDVGIAFQIADDLLDVLGDEATTGKSLGTDLDQKKPTLPVIRLLEVVDDEEREQLLEVLTGEPQVCQDLLPAWLDRYDTIDYARRQALAYSKRAAEALSFLPDSPAANVLRLIAEFAVLRSQ